MQDRGCLQPTGLKEAQWSFLGNPRVDLGSRGLSRDDRHVSGNILNHWRPTPKSPCRTLLTQNLQWLPTALQIPRTQCSFNHTPPLDGSRAAAKPGFSPPRAQPLFSLLPDFTPVASCTQNRVLQPSWSPDAPRGLSQIQMPGSSPSDPYLIVWGGVWPLVFFFKKAPQVVLKLWADRSRAVSPAGAPPAKTSIL